MPPIANYVPYVVTGNLVVVSGQVPAVDGKIAITGKVGGGVSIEQGKRGGAAMLHQRAGASEGGLRRRSGPRAAAWCGWAASSPAPPEFTQHAQVMNGASDLAVAVFGEAGRHARTTIGVPSLPADAAVEVEGMFEIAIGCPSCPTAPPRSP